MKCVVPVVCGKSCGRPLRAKQTNKQIVYCQSRHPQRSCIINTNLDTMIRLIYMISISIIHRYTSYIYIYMGNRLLVYEYKNHKDHRLIIQEAEHHIIHMSENTFTYYMKTNK